MHHLDFKVIAAVLEATVTLDVLHLVIKREPKAELER